MVSGQLIWVRKYRSMQATNEMMARVDNMTVRTTIPVGPFKSKGWYAIMLGHIYRPLANFQDVKAVFMGLDPAMPEAAKDSSATGGVTLAS